MTSSDNDKGASSQPLPTAPDILSTPAQDTPKTLNEAPATALALVMQFAAQSSVLAMENSVITNNLINKMAVTSNDAMMMQISTNANALSALTTAQSQANLLMCAQVSQLGVAMQNIVVQQQTLAAITNAIAAKALNLIPNPNSSAASELARKQFEDTLSKLTDLLTRLSPDGARAQSNPTGTT